MDQIELFNHSSYLKSFNCVQINKSSKVGIEGDLKAPFSIATAPRCREGLYIRWEYLINRLTNVKQKYVKL